MKKTLAIIMAVIMAVFAFSTANAATGTGSDLQYTYNEVDGGIRIDRVSGKLSSTFEIPGEIDGKTVIAIGDNPCMFINYYDVEKVIIPDSVKKIGNFAFANFHIREIELPAGLEVIGNHAFEGSMLTKITIPNGVKEIGNNAFGKCTKLTSIAVPDSVEKFGYAVFSGCTSLETASLGSIHTVPNATFYECRNLQDVDMDEYIAKIENYAFHFAIH